LFDKPPVTTSTLTPAFVSVTSGGVSREVSAGSVIAPLGAPVRSYIISN